MKQMVLLIIFVVGCLFSGFIIGQENLLDTKKIVTDDGKKIEVKIPHSPPNVDVAKIDHKLFNQNQRLERAIEELRDFLDTNEREVDILRSKIGELEQEITELKKIIKEIKNDNAN